MFRRKTLFFALMLALAGPIAARVAAGQTLRPDMLKLVPEPLPAGAVATDPASFYSPDNLYKYMDGGADIFVQYGVRNLLHLDFRAQAVEGSLDVFDMGSQDAAFGIYAAERSPDYQFLTIGAEGYWNTGILNFVQDSYYVKLSGFGDGADAVLASLAKAVSAKIGGTSELPSLLARLPIEGRKPHSERYMPIDPLGHPFLGPAYVVSFGAGEQESKLYVTIARDPADAQQRLKELSDHFAKTGRCKSAPEIAEQAIRASNSFEGALIAQAAGRYVVLLLNPAEGGEKLLKSAAERLQ